MVTNLPYIKGELSAGYAEFGYFMAGFPLGYVVGSILVGKVTYKKSAYTYAWRIVYRGSHTFR